MKKIESFEKLTWSVADTSVERKELEIVKTDNGVTLSLYCGAWLFDDNTEREKCLSKKAFCGDETYDEITEFLNRYKVKKWDGYVKSNPHVLDGTMFFFDLVIDSETTLSAHGTNSFPSGYWDLWNALYSILEENAETEVL